MKRTLVGLLVSVALVVGSPRVLAAQCGGDCLVITNAEGTMMFSCYHSPGSGLRCTSWANGCRLVVCETALLTDATGRPFALASVCDGKRSVRAVASVSASREAKPFAQRAVVGDQVLLPDDPHERPRDSADVVIESL